MHKLIVLFRTPEDPPAFERRWSEAFLPLAEKMPGLRRIVVSRIQGGPGGSVDFHLVHEFFFDDERALRAAMASPAGQKAGQALMAFAADRVTLCFAEHLEEDRT